VSSLKSFWEGASGGTSPRGPPAAAAGGGFLEAMRSPRGSTHGAQQPASLKKALATRGGVAREQDGFEVFYGLESKSPREHKVRGGQDSRDGFERFFGIDRRDRERPAVEPPAGAADPEPSEALGRSRQLESQLQARLTGGSPQGAAPLAWPDVAAAASAGDGAQEVEVASSPSAEMRPRRSSAATSPSAHAASPSPGDGSVPQGVPTFSMSDALAVPRNVPTFSLSSRDKHRSGAHGDTPMRRTSTSGP